MRSFDGSYREWCRLAACRGDLLSARAFWRRRGISRAELRRLQLPEYILSVEVAHKHYYPAELVGLPPAQLVASVEAMQAAIADAGVAKARASLGDISAMQSLSHVAR